MFVAVRPAYTVGPAFWRKRGGDFGDGGAEMFKHVADHWVGLNQQAIRLNLAGRVAVADVPGKLGEVGTGDRKQRLCRRNNLDTAAI